MRIILLGLCGVLASKLLEVIIPCFKAVVAAGQFEPPKGMKNAIVTIPLSCVIDP